MRVLIADDCPVTRMRLKKHLTEWGFQPVIVHDGEQAIASLTSKFAPRLAILDWMMPKFDGTTVTQRIRQEEVGPYTYVVMLTAKTDHADLVSAFAAGIDDFLTKPFDAEELHQRLRAGQRILQLQDQLNDMLVQLRYQATHDTLTGIWNRRSILDSLERELNRASRCGREASATSIALLDIDHFKSINDMHGHHAGDAVLQSVADTITKTLRSYDFVGRYGGEEFIIVLPATGREHLELVVNRIRANIEASSVEIDGKKIQVTASFGVVSAEKNSSVEGLIKSADAAMYEAKQAGRNCYVFADQLPAEPLPIELG